MIDANFILDRYNILLIKVNFPESTNIHELVLRDDKDEIYIKQRVQNNSITPFNFLKVFKYNIQLFSFNGDVIEMIEEKKFDISNHNFNIR